MKQPSPLILIGLLLIALIKLNDQPLITTAALGVLVILALVMVGRLQATLPWARRQIALPATRIAQNLKGMRALLAIIGICIVIAGCSGMYFTRPQLRTAYIPDTFPSTPDITEHRGFFETETDAAGNRYVWTQDRATLVFDFLVHRPITITFDIRSAAVAGGPDAPVRVLVNGVEADMLRPDPKNTNFQSFSLRIVPYNWGGEQTEIKLVPQTFRPGRGDNRVLGTMVQRITIDKSEAWSAIGRRLWLIGLLPLFALIALMLAWMTYRFRSAIAGYGAIAVCVMGALSAVLIVFLVLRIGFIARATYVFWVMSGICITIAFMIGAITLPFGKPGARSLLQWIRLMPANFVTFFTIVRRWSGTFLLPEAGESTPPRRQIARDLLLVFTVALGIRLIWVFVIPPWQSPDEPEHYVYIKHIAEQGRLPFPPDLAYPQYSQEDTTDWMYTFLKPLSPQIAKHNDNLLLPYVPFDYDYASARAYKTNPRDRYTSDGGRATSYPPLYYLVEVVPYALFKNAPVLFRLYATRCGSAIMGALSCIFAYLLAYQVRRTRYWGWALGLCMALMPMYAFITATVNNDVGMDLCASALIWLTVRAYQQEELSYPLAVALGVTSGLTLLTKPTVAPLVLTVGAVLLVKLVADLRASWQRVQPRLLTLGAYLATAFIVYCPYMLVRLRYSGTVGFAATSVTRVFRFLAAGTPVAAAPTVPNDAALTAPHVGALFASLSPWEYLKGQTGQGGVHLYFLFIQAFWGFFGWLDAVMPERYYTFVMTFCVISGIGLVIQLVLQPAQRRILLLLIGIIIAQVILLFGADYYLSFVAGTPLGLQGRYFFPILAPLLLLLFSGWDHLFRGRRIGLQIAVVLMFGAQLAGLATMFARYYGVRFG